TVCGRQRSGSSTGFTSPGRVSPFHHRSSSTSFTASLPGSSLDRTTWIRTRPRPPRRPSPRSTSPTTRTPPPPPSPAPASPVRQPEAAAATWVIAINKEFPGPVVNVTTNYNVAVNVLNSLDEPLLITWDGIQQRKNCWQDGVLGTNCPIPPGWNWTYNFQVMDDACKSLDYPEDQTCAFSSVSSDISAAMLFYLYSVWSDLWFLDGLGYPIYLSFIS
uniref:Plastocyanin-like domain-containing protein n=3 Tax=Aegilops tauschii subsp. strangulata TaxID=200361 RepID=A0A453L460_AEGTS